MTTTMKHSPHAETGHGHHHGSSGRPGSSSGFAFPKSGLGTPDFLYFGGPTSAGASTPSWLRPSTASSLKDAQAIKAEDSDGDDNDTPFSSDRNAKGAGGEGVADQTSAKADEAARTTRALSDPPVRQSPAWLGKHSRAAEPNPFEHSFSGTGSYAPTTHQSNKNVSVIAASPRRARSNSPKLQSSGLGGLAVGVAAGHPSVSVNRANPYVKTPGNEFSQFGWALGGDATAINATTHNTFDPSSIRTGFTPAGIDTSSYGPHSPATQALFALMTNQTPDVTNVSKPVTDTIMSHPRHHHDAEPNRFDSQFGVGSTMYESPVLSQGSPQQQNRSTRGKSSLGSQDGSHDSGNNSRGHSGSLHASPPRHVFAHQAMPRPLPPYSIPPAQMHNVQNQPIVNIESAPLDPIQQAINDDALLAAAALSGLSTPRPAYVGGPPPVPSTMNPGNMINASAALRQYMPTQVNLQLPSATNSRNQPVAPPDMTLDSAINAALAKGPSNGNSGMNESNQADGPLQPAGAKRKRGANNTTASTQQVPKVEPKKAKRTTSRRSAAAKKVSSDNEFDDQLLGNGQFDMDDGDDMDDGLSQAGSFEGGERGGSIGPSSKGGQKGPKQQFETEEDKRKNFLERNRQAALKCRQRKKQWLQQLQQRVEYLTADNDTLQSTVTSLRDEVAGLRRLLIAHKDCQLGNPAMGGPLPPGALNGNVTVGAYMNQLQNQSGSMPHHM